VYEITGLEAPVELAVFRNGIEVRVMRANIDGSVWINRWAGWHDVTRLEAPNQTFLIRLLGTTTD
jgi:hypothetical protein